MSPMTVWDVLLVHGNEDVMEATLDSYPEALEWAVREEARRGHSIEGLRAAFELSINGRVQLGTNYHYVNFQENHQ